MTYYKYKERDATSQVNWADVSKKFSDEIGRIGKERATKREAIDKATDDLVTKINKAPMGQHKNANLFTSQLVDQATQDTLRMNNLLKSGDIRPSEYMNYIENQKSSVTGLYDMVTGYQDVYTDKMTRMQNGQSLPFEWEGMAAVEGFGNFANTTPVLDQYGNYTMVNDATGQTMSVAEMNAITKQYFNAYDIDGAMKNKVDLLGEYIKVQMTGNVKTVADVRQQEGFSEYEQSLVDEILEGPLAVSTVLTQDLPGYTTSFVPGDDLDKVLTSILDPRQPGSGAQVPLVEVVEQVEKMTDDQRREIFSEDADVDALIRIAKDQRKAAEDWAKETLNYRFGRTETARQEFQPRTTDSTKKGREVAALGVNNLQKLWGAKTDEEFRQAVGFFEKQDPNLKIEGVIEGGQRKLAITRGDGDTKFYNIGDDYAGFVEQVASALMDVTYLDTALQQNPLDNDKYPGVGSGIGIIERRYVPDRDNMGEESVELAGSSVRVDSALDALEGVPSVGVLGTVAGTGMNEDEQNKRMQDAVTTFDILFSSKFDPNDEVQVTGVTKSQSQGDYPEIVIKINGVEERFSTVEGEFERAKNRVKELLKNIGQPASNKINYAGK